MLDKIITWLIKKLVLLWDRHNDKIAFSFARDERTDYSVLVERFYDDCYTIGTAKFPWICADIDTIIDSYSEPPKEE